MHDARLERVLGRKESAFLPDIRSNRRRLASRIRGARVLVIGAAGSLGASFVRQTVPFRPAALHLMDPAENSLVELVRDLRSSAMPGPEDFRTFSIGLGSAEGDRFLADNRRYDFVANFAALKHVRAARDPYTLMRMFDTNVLQASRLMQAAAGMPVKNVFSVSSDKAVRPESALGFSKLLMERVMLAGPPSVPSTTCRCANVAFSQGSLLDGFRRRIEKGQPLSGPDDVERYFVSEEEAGHLCLLACFLGADGDAFVPGPRAALEALTFPEMAERFLRSLGLRPDFLASEAQARRAASRLGPRNRAWPCHFSPSDTAGEKPREEFVAPEERVDDRRFRAVAVVRRRRPDAAEARGLLQMMRNLGSLRAGRRWTHAGIQAALAPAAPGLRLPPEGKNLDQKM